MKCVLRRIEPLLCCNTDNGNVGAEVPDEFRAKTQMLSIGVAIAGVTLLVLGGALFGTRNSIMISAGCATMAGGALMEIAGLVKFVRW